MPLSSRSRRPWRLSVRARGLDRAACDLLAGPCVAAAARRALAGRLLCASHLWRKTGHCWPHAAVLAAGLCWCLDVMDCSIVMSETQRVQLDHRTRLRLQVGGSLLAQPARGLAAPAGVACSASRFGRLELHVGTASSRSSVRCADRRDAGFKLPRRAAPADEGAVCCRCCAAGRVARVRLLVVAS
jgi:hypothetical protein